MVWMLHILLYDVFLVTAREGPAGGGGWGGGGEEGEEESGGERSRRRNEAEVRSCLFLRDVLTGQYPSGRIST